MPRLEVIIVKVNLHWPNGLFFAISPNDAFWNIHHQPGALHNGVKEFVKFIFVFQNYFHGIIQDTW